MKETIIKILGRISTTVSRTLNILKNKTTRLPWKPLKRTEGNIPWEALEKFADAVASDGSVVNKLIKQYERALPISYERESHENFYIPAIFALAAPRLSDKRRHEIGMFLIEKLTEASREDDDLLMEVLTAACGSLGPAILPLVLDAIAKEPDHSGAWFHLWGLTGLAADTKDAEIRSQIIEACVDLLKQAERGVIEPIVANDAAWTLARMNCSQYTGLLQWVKRKSMKSFCHADFANALLLLEGRLDYTPPANMWEEPVKDWLEPRWKMAKEWYAEGSDGHDEDEDAYEQRIWDMADRFTKSPAAARLDSDLLEDAFFIAFHILQYAWVYAGTEPEELDEGVLSKVLLEIFPRKVTAERELFEKVAPVTEIFLKWLGSENILDKPSALAETVRDWSEAIVAHSMNPAYWGMAKILMMQAKSDGVDIDDEEALQRYIAERNRRLFTEQKSPDYRDSTDWTPLIPIVNLAPKIGRNDPCPCGSSKKYKKCCGRTTSVGIDM